MKWLANFFKTTDGLPPQMTYLNHLQFGYDGKPFVFRTSPTQQWTVKYGRCQRRPHQFHRECVETARTIGQQTTQAIWVLFSGGIDSEVTLRSFVAADIPVNVAILRFKNNLNQHDISWAIRTCKELSLSYHFFDLDILHFWQYEARHYADLTYCFSPQLIATMWLMDQVPGYPVMGGGECLLVKKDPLQADSDWVLFEKERIAAWYRFLIKRKRAGCPGFFQFTPEIILSYLLDPMVKELTNNQLSSALSSEAHKLAIYQQHFPLLPRPKYTGFETLQAEDALLRNELKAKFPGTDEVFKTSYSALIKMLSP